MKFATRMVLSLIVVLSCSSLGFTKSFFLEMSFLRNRTLNHQSCDHESQPQGDAFRPEESINQENVVTIEVNRFHNKANDHNRTARDASHPCYSHAVRKWDSCRNSYVNEAQCISNHVACYKVGTLCAPVFGYRQAKFISKCTAVQIGCQCKV